MFKQSLNDLLFILDQDKVPADEAELLKSAILIKVDNCAIVKREMEDEAARLRGIAKEFAEAARVSERRLDRFMAYVKMAMESQGFEKLPGNNFQAVLKLGPEKIEMDQEATEDDWCDYPDFVKCEYKWIKAAIKDAISQETHDIPFARVVREKYVQFAIRKGAV